MRIHYKWAQGKKKGIHQVLRMPKKFDLQDQEVKRIISFTR